MQLKEKIKEIREHFNLSQEFVGKKMNRSQSTYGKLETGSTNIAFSDIELFANAVNLSVIDVITWPEKWVPDKTKYQNSETVDFAEENYTTCKHCKEKDERIQDLKENIMDLRKQVSFLGDLPKKVRDVS